MNIFVAKLSFRTSEATLSELFGRYGEVSSVKIIMDRDTGRSKGYGFVEMANDAEALIAIEEINESTVDGRTILAQRSRPNRR